MFEFVYLKGLLKIKKINVEKNICLYRNGIFKF